MKQSENGIEGFVLVGEITADTSAASQNKYITISDQKVREAKRLLLFLLSVRMEILHSKIRS